MPTKVERCVKEVKAKGKGKSSAYAICNASLKNKAKATIGMKKKSLFSPSSQLGVQQPIQPSPTQPVSPIAAPMQQAAVTPPLQPTPTQPVAPFSQVASRIGASPQLRTGMNNNTLMSLLNSKNPEPSDFRIKSPTGTAGARG